MSKSNISKKSSQDINQALNTTGLDSITELINNKRKLFWLNVTAGFTRGFFGVLGAAVAVVVIGFLVSKLGWVPYIGEFFQSLGSAV